jgi:hypothetical protein
MRISDLKNWLRRSLDPWAPVDDIPGQLEREGISFDFSNDFNRKISERLSGLPASRLQSEFLNSYVFTRVALTGVAAILILLLTIFLTQGTLSFDSVLGLTDSSEESIVFLLTGI